MMLFFSPQFSSCKLNLQKAGQILSINGDDLDFSNLPDGGELPPEAINNDFVVGSIRRIDGKVHMTIILPYSNPNAPRPVTFPEPILVAEDGPIALPEGRYVD